MLSTGIGVMILRPLCRGVAAAAVPVVIPAVATYAGGYVAECAVGAISGCFNRVRGRVKLTVQARGVYVIVDGVLHEIDCAKKYEITGGKLREIPDDVDENWTIL